MLGRNIYQCADGSERRSIAILGNLRAELAQLPLDAATHLLNGMFFEAYFNKEGEFRGQKLKGRYLERLLKLQTVKKFAPSIEFIRRALQPLKRHLPFLPSADPETVEFVMTVRRSDPPVVKSLRLRGCELLTIDEEDKDLCTDVFCKVHDRATDSAACGGLEHPSRTTENRLRSKGGCKDRVPAS